MLVQLRIAQILVRNHKYYLRAHDVDAALITASRAINDSLKEIAEQRAKDGVFFADSATRLNELSPHGVAGNEFFEDHVHMTIEGSYVVASTIFDAIKDRLPDWVKKDLAGGPDAPSIEECKARLAVTPVEELRRAKQNVAKSQNEIYKHSVDFFQDVQKQIEQELQGKDPIKIEADGCMRALELNPRDFFVRQRSVNALLQAQRMQEAELIARETLNLFPYLWRARKLLSNTLGALEKQDEALEVFRKQIVNFPDIAESHFVLGNMLKNMGRKQEALDEFRKAAELKPINDVALVAEGQTLEEMGDWTNAMNSYLSAIRTIPEEPDSYRALYEVLKSNTETSARLTCWKRLAKSVGYLPTAHVYYGIAMEDQGDKSAAIIEYRKALELNSNTALALARLGEALATEGNAKEASDFLKRAAEAGLTQKIESPRLIAALRAQNMNDLANKEEQRCKIANIPLADQPS
jgi:tetratricopeptide (TPR) repeat protein